MTNSERRRVACRNLLAWGALLIPLLACVEGDLASMGCPPGERCMSSGSLSFFRASAVRCGVLRNPISPGTFGPGTLDPLIFDRGTTAVALGGRTQASAWSGILGPSFAEARFSEHYEALTTEGDARAIAVGPGRFSAYDHGGALIDYVAMPVEEAETAMVLDDLACPDQPRVLLRGLGFIPRPLVLGRGGRALVDLDATISTMEPATDGAVRLLVRFAGGREVIDELDEVEAIERIEPILTPLQQLLDGPALAVEGWTRVCFQAFVGDAVALGVPVSSAVSDSPELDPSLDGQCIVLTDTRAELGPALTAHLTVTMAGSTRTFDVHLRAIAAL